MRTVETLIQACLFDDMRMLSRGAIVDYGFADATTDNALMGLFSAYQYAVRHEMTDADKLHEAVCDGEKLTAILTPTGLLEEPVRCVKFEYSEDFPEDEEDDDEN